MANKETLEGLINREVGTIELFLQFKAKKIALLINEYIATAQVQGQTFEAIRATLEDDYNNGGRIFGEFKNSIKATTSGAINRLRDVGEFSEIGIDQSYRWAAVLVNTCPDCIERHNMPAMKWDEWEAMGLPRTGTTVCKEHCRCMLIPEEFATTEPIKRERRP
jgi:hypothetical protein